VLLLVKLNLTLGIALCINIVAEFPCTFCICHGCEIMWWVLRFPFCTKSKGGIRSVWNWQHCKEDMGASSVQRLMVQVIQLPRENSDKLPKEWRSQRPAILSYHLNQGFYAMWRKFGSTSSREFFNICITKWLLTDKKRDR